jgi:hypothetical protein
MFPTFLIYVLHPPFAAPQMVFRVGIALLASAQEQLCAMPFERLVAALNGRKFPILNKQPDALMKVRDAVRQVQNSELCVYLQVHGSLCVGVFACL